MPAPPLAASDSDALFLDVDGTLLQIADRPEAVKVPSGMLDVLERLHGCFGGAVALVSGRTIANLDALFAPLRLASAGVHGLQRRGADGVVHHRDVEVLLAPLRQPMNRFVQAHDGLLLEDKGQSLAIHYRNAPESGRKVEAMVRELIAAAGAASLELKRGKMVLEVKPDDADKGTAIAAFMQEPPFLGRRPVFFGDDITDEDGFAVVNSLSGVAVRVGSEEADTAARHCLPDEAAVHAWLRRLADAANHPPGPADSDQGRPAASARKGR